MDNIFPPSLVVHDWTQLGFEPVAAEWMCRQSEWAIAGPYKNVHDKFGHFYERNLNVCC